MQQFNLLGTDAVARQLQVTRRTVQRMATDGRLVAHRMPGATGALLFEQDAVDALMTEQDAA